MSKSTILAECTIKAFSVVQIELAEANETPAVILIHWPSKVTVLHPSRFPETAAVVARTMAAASTELASIKSRRGLL